MLLQNKTAIITGASRGIGKATAIEFAKNGSNLILTSQNNISKLDELKAELGNLYKITIQTFQFDISNTDEVKVFYKQIIEQKIIIDILVNNAGIMEDALLMMVKPESIEKTFRINVFGTMYMCQNAIKLMIRNKRGSIINLSSIMGTNGNAGQSVYSSSKAAIIGFTKALSKEMAPLNIRVNAVAPGFIDTDLTSNVKDSFIEKNISTIKMGRIGKPEEVANTIVYLASDLSEYVTGQTIGVNGSMII